ncbi:MAG: hypothetical protein KAI81_07345 [Candidatus Marinimicrobia bacterium]|nr:hypothetical protein [Candidatus Neomarinimicrobiota bacterium]
MQEPKCTEQASFQLPDPERSQRTSFFILFLLFVFIHPLSLLSNGTSPVYKIISEEPEKRYVKTLESYCGELIKEIEKSYGLIPDSFIVIIAANEEDFYTNLHPDFPHWGIAAAKYSESSIVLKSPRFSKQNIAELKKTLAHELIHIALLPRIRGKYFPRWMNEGFAQYFAGQSSFQNKILLGQQAAWNSFPSLSKIDDVLKFNQRKANAAYAQSLSAFTWLIEEFGSDNFTHFLDLLENYYFDEAFEMAYGFEEALFDLSWRNYAVKKYRPYLLLDVYSWIWGLAPILVMIGWWKKRQKAKLIQIEWEILENDDPEQKNSKINAN